MRGLDLRANGREAGGRLANRLGTFLRASIRPSGVGLHPTEPQLAGKIGRRVLTGLHTETSPSNNGPKPKAGP